MRLERLGAGPERIGIWEGMQMRTFLVAVVAAVLIAGAAAFVLNTYVPDTSAGAFSTQGVRI
jgi:hypothetical protein